eukprot:6558748-Alexandrium_andersonii.AAC.1
MGVSRATVDLILKWIAAARCNRDHAIVWQRMEPRNLERGTTTSDTTTHVEWLLESLKKLLNQTLHRLARPSGPG